MIGAADVADMLQGFGEPATLRRIGSPNIDVSVTAKIGNPAGAIEQRDSNASRVAPGNIAQFRRSVIISNVEIADASWPGPPRRDDQVIVGGKTMTVQSVDTTTIGSETVMHVLNTVGA